MKTSPVNAILIALMVCCITGALFLKIWTYPLLLLASIGFLAIAWISGANQTPFGRRIGMGLILCFLGDAIGPHHFIVGSVAFLIAHLVFIMAFINHGLNRQHTTIGCLIAFPISTAVLVYLWPSVSPEYHMLVIVYTTVITLMVVLSAGTQTWILIGAIIFYLSDIFVARWKFIGGSHNAYFCYPLYYTACTMLALSIQRMQGGNDETGRPAVQTV